MKTRSIASLTLLSISAFLLILSTSCSETKKAAAFDVTYDLPRVYFNYSVTLLKRSEVILYSGEDKINLDSILMAHDIPTGMITSAKMSLFSMTLTDPPDANFGWLQSMELQVSANTSFDPNIELGNFVNNDSTAKIVNLTLNNVEMIPYMNNSTFYYRILATLKTGPLRSNTVTMFRDLQLKLHIEPL